MDNSPQLFKSSVSRGALLADLRCLAHILASVRKAYWFYFPSAQPLQPHVFPSTAVFVALAPLPSSASPSLQASLLPPHLLP